MARERVQVQGLGDAVPGISPTIQRAGQYSIAQVRAGRNKWHDLADALGQVNPMLQQYTRVADIEAEQFEQELAGKSPEEVQAMLKQTEGELDKQVRRGGMGWLTSPLNQKRKLKAIGQASSRLLMEEVYNRLESPQAGDEELSTREIIAQVQQNFVGNNEALTNSVFAQEGLQQAVNPQILPLVRQYDAQKARLGKAETSYGTSSVLYDQAENIGSIGEFNEESAQALTDAWSNLSSFSVDEQRNIVGGVLRKLANNGLKEEAEDLLDFAKKNLKFGAASMSDMDYESFDEEIEIIAKRAEDRQETERVEKVKETAADAFKALLDIRNPNIETTTFDGKTITTEEELRNAVQVSTVFADDNEGLRDFVKTFESDRVQLRDPIEYLTQAAYQQVDEDIGMFIKQTDAEFRVGDISTAFIENPDLFTEFSNNLIIDVYEESERLARESKDSDPFKLKLQLSQFARTRGRELKNQFKADLRRTSLEKEKEAVKIKQQGSAVQASTPNIIPSFIFPETLDGKQGKIQNDLSVLFNTTDIPEQKAIAYKNIINVSNEDLDATIDEITGRKPKVAESVSFGNVPALGISPRISKAQQFSREEIQAKEIIVAGVLNQRGDLLDIKALKRGSVRGYGLNVKRLTTDQHFLLTDEEVEAAKGLSNKEIEQRKNDPLIKNILEVSKIIGIEDYANFVIDQDKLYLLHKKITGFKTLERK